MPAPSRPDRPRGRAGGALLWAGGLLLLLIAVFTARVLRHYPRTRVEVGRVKMLRLEPATRARLRTLSHEALITYYSSGRSQLPSVMRGVERSVTALLAAMQRESHGRLAFQIVDPDADPEWARHAAHQRVSPYRVRTVTRDAYEEQTVWSALHLAYGPFPPAVLNGISTAYLPRLQSMLVEQLDQMEHPRPPLFGLAAPGGYRELETALAARGQVRRLDLEGGDDLPDELDVLFWMEPRSLSPRVVQRLDRFVNRGGSVVIAGSKHEVQMNAQGGEVIFQILPRPHAAESWLAALGLRSRSELVLDSFCRQVEAGGAPHPVRFLVRCIASNQDFRTLTGLPNGDLLFVAPTAFELDGETLARQGWEPVVLATSSDGTTVRAMRYGEVRLGSPALEPGDPAPKLPLMVWLRPREPWRGSVVAAAAATPFQDGYLGAEGLAHRRMLEELSATLASAERLVLRRSGLGASEALRELEASNRLFWRCVCVVLPAFVLGVVAWRRGIFRAIDFPGRRAGSRPTGLAARAALGLSAVLATAAAVRLPGWRVDASADGVNHLSAAAQRVARASAGAKAVQVNVLFSRPERLPPDWRPLARRLQATLGEFRRAGAPLALTWTPPEELPAPRRQELEQAGLRQLRLTTRDEEITQVRSCYSTIQLTAQGRTEWLEFREPAAFEQSEFRLAFALWRLRTGRQPHVAFVADLPRLSPAEALEDFQKKNLLAPSGTDVHSLARAALVEAGFRVTHVNPQSPALPAETGLVVWMQPRRNIRPMLDQVVAFLHRGGAVLLAAQHFNLQARQYKGASFKMVYWPQPQAPDIDEYYFPKLGIELVREVLFDELKAPLALQTQVNRAPGERDYVNEVSALPFMIRAAAANYAASAPVTRGLGDQLLPFANHFELNTNQLAALAIRATPLMTTSAQSWSFRWKGGWLPAEVLAGPPTRETEATHRRSRSPLAVLLEGPFPLPARPFSEQTEPPDLLLTNRASADPEGKLLLLGCSQVFRNERFANPQFRGDHLLLNAAASLALDPDLAEIATHRAAARGFGLVDSQRRFRWRVIVLAGGPSLLLAVGWIWRRTRRQESWAWGGKAGAPASGRLA